MIELPFLHWMKKQTRKIDQVAVDDPPATNSLADLLVKLYDFYTMNGALRLLRYSIAADSTEYLAFDITGRGILKHVNCDEDGAMYVQVTKIEVDGVAYTTVNPTNWTHFFSQESTAFDSRLIPLDIYFTTSCKVYAKNISASSAWGINAMFMIASVT